MVMDICSLLSPVGWMGDLNTNGPSSAIETVLPIIVGGSMTN